MTLFHSPASLNYALPAEWEPHYGTWLTYPHNPKTFFTKIESARQAIVQMIRYISPGEIVHINVNDPAMEKDLRNRLAAEDISRNLKVHYFPSNDAWSRDHGAIFVKNTTTGEVAATSWTFNAWGNKYDAEKDNQLASRMARQLGCTEFPHTMVLEGGAIDSNGQGLLLTTESCLLNPNRNPSLAKQDIEKIFYQYFGIYKTIWLKDGIAGDDTDGHVDDITRFVTPDTVLTAVENNKNDPNYEPLKNNLEILRSARDQNGKPLNIITLPMPAPVYYGSERLPASYANFYIANRVVILPTFNCDQDVQAMEVLQRVFPNRQVVGIPAQDLVVGLGTFHCLSQQIPLGTNLH